MSHFTRVQPLNGIEEVRGSNPLGSIGPFDRLLKVGNQRSPFRDGEILLLDRAVARISAHCTGARCPILVTLERLAAKYFVYFGCR